MNRGSITRLVLALAVFAAGASTAAAQRRTENVVLVTLDGARHQEIFGGLDLEVLRSVAGKTPVESHPLYTRYGAPTPEERRMKLMPFFWGTLMKEGSIAAISASAASRGSRTRITSPIRVTPRS